MAENKVLQKPKFIKVADIETARSGYNVYVKIVSAEKKEIDTRDGGKVTMVECIVGDETATAKAFFKGENAHLIEKDNVIAIRNGVKRFVKDHISLEVDLFGRVTLEKGVTIASVAALNISDAEHKLSDKPRQNRQTGGRRDNRGNNDRRPRRNDGQYRNNRDDRKPREDRRPREDRGPREDRRPRQDREDRKPREPREPREQREPREPREPRRNNQQRKDDNKKNETRAPQRSEHPQKHEEYKQENSRRPVRDREEGQRSNNYERRNNDRDLDRNDNRRPNRGYDRDFDRNDKPQRNYDQPRKQYEQKREENRERRAPLKWNKLVDIQPGEDSLNLTVKVLKVEKVGNKLRCVIGDDSGISNAFLFENSVIQEGESIVLFNAKSEVVKEHIEIQLERRGRVDIARRQVTKVNEEYNLSLKAWVPAD